MTTRARWLNHFVFAELALLKRIPAIRKVEKPIFIVGVGRSGTTILGEVLDRHRQLGLLNEPKALWHSIYPYEDLVGSYSDGTARYIMGASEASELVARSAQRLYSHFLLLSGARRVVDKYPEMIFRLDFIRAMFPDAKLVWIVRDGWDVIHSIVRWSTENRQTIRGEVHDWWGRNRRKWNLLVEEVIPREPLLAGLRNEVARLTKEEDRAAVEWIVTSQAGLRSQLHGSVVFPVRYEALTRDPETELRKLIGYLELETDEAMSSFASEQLRPRPARNRIELSGVLQEAFQATMAALDYAE